MEKLVVAVLLCFFGYSAAAIEVEFIKSVSFPKPLKFKKTEVGGLSALYYDSSEDLFYAVSDDRGRKGDPRFYKFKMDKDFQFKLIDEIKITDLKKKGHDSKILDLEAMVFLPWGNFLFSSEGDLNQIPRLMPELVEVKINGEFMRTYDLPAEFYPEKIGKQTKGLQNNAAIEGMCLLDSFNILTATESGLFSDQKPESIMTLMNLSEAWNIKPSLQFRYPLNPENGIKSGLSEILCFSENQILTLERGVSVNKGGLSYDVLMYSVDLDRKQTGIIKVGEKKLIYDFKAHSQTENYEGMTLGPLLEGKYKSLFVISDNNFKKSEKTQILVFKIK